MAEDRRWREKKVKRDSVQPTKERKLRAFYYTIGQRSRKEDNSVRLQRTRTLKQKASKQERKERKKKQISGKLGWGTSRENNVGRRQMTRN